MGATGKTADVNKVSQTQPQSQSKQRFCSGTGTCKQPADKGRGQGQGNKQRTSRQNFSNPCFLYGWDHHSGDCHYKNAECRKYGKIGHIARRCSQNRRKNYATNLIDEDYYYDSSDDVQYSLQLINYAEGSAQVYRITGGSDKYQVSVKANDGTRYRFSGIHCE